MSFKALFKRKPGGTFLGNLVRKAASQATGGVLGKGSLKISQNEYDLKNLNDQDFTQKYGKNKTGSITTGSTNPDIKTIDQQISEIQDQQHNEAGKSTLMATLKMYFKKFWYVLIVPGGIIIYLVFGRKKSFKSKRRY